MTNAEFVVKTVNRIKNKEKREYAFHYLDFLHTRKSGEYWETSAHNPENYRKDFQLGTVGKQATIFLVRDLLGQFGG